MEIRRQLDRPMTRHQEEWWEAIREKVEAERKLKEAAR